MEIISFEKRTFEEIAAKLDYFVQRVESKHSINSPFHSKNVILLL